MQWLVDPNSLAKMEKAYEANILPTAEQQESFAARSGRDENGVPLIMSIAGGTAQISISGLLTEKPDWLAEFFGGGNTTYPDIITALSVAQSEASVNEVILNVNSGGGQIAGLFDAIAAVQAFSKPIRAKVGNMAASAAYGLIASVDSIEASNRASQIGSIGIAATFAFSNDIEEVTITSSEAPDKRPDVKTEEGQAVIREQLDALHELFAEAIADGRGTSVSDVNKNFGRGAVLLAEEAMSRGMIDSVAGVVPSLEIVGGSEMDKTAATGGDNKEKGVIMTLKELQAGHPELFQAAVEQGVQQERDRVTAHLTMGKASGDTETAFAAIEDGSEMTATLQAKYVSAGMNRADINARQEDSEDVVAETADADEASALTQIIEGAAHMQGAKLEI